MKSKCLLTTCITLGVALTGCEKPKTRQDSHKGQAEAIATQPDAAVVARVKKEVGHLLDKSPDTIKLTDQFIRDLGADSLDTVEIVMVIEETFNIAIADADAEKLITVGDLIDYVCAKIKPAAGVPVDTGASLVFPPPMARS